ncbi:hypothetical protein NE237_011962 [Protea cynaroides]|uniref:Uncharacterized protein n=1 Tax=Protea cynaroides TaxID=273540 RepID=A0A9Q0H0Y5_9MAGN|nr:hypothetical protein NE237_011962 [Protea cynaroides]
MHYENVHRYRTREELLAWWWRKATAAPIRSIWKRSAFVCLHSIWTVTSLPNDQNIQNVGGIPSFNNLNQASIFSYINNGFAGIQMNNSGKLSRFNQMPSGHWPSNGLASSSGFVPQGLAPPGGLVPLGTISSSGLPNTVLFSPIFTNVSQQMLLFAPFGEEGDSIFDLKKWDSLFGDFICAII